MDVILVPQGYEYQSVCRGLQANTAKPLVLPIPIGTESLSRYLKRWQQEQKLATDSQHRVLLMGLCGSLSPRWQVGDIVLYQNCLSINSASSVPQPCNRHLTRLLQYKLAAPLVQSLTSDRLIWSSSEKHRLADKYGADVVDMEGFAALEVLQGNKFAVAMIRVVSDGCDDDLPDLSTAIAADGSLQPLPLGISMLKQPLAATRLIRGSLKGLSVLQQVTKQLFSEQNQDFWG